MGRSRSRSPRRERKRRSKSKSRDRDRERDRDQERDRDLERDREQDRERRRHQRTRSRSRSPRSSRKSPRHHRQRKRSRSGSQSNDDVVYTGTTHVNDSQLDESKKISDPSGPIDSENPDEAEMMRLMGFTGFDTTKGKRVGGSDSSAVSTVQKRKYRQYMNRRGGFNRPLDFVA